MAKAETGASRQRRSSARCPGARGGRTRITGQPYAEPAEQGCREWSGPLRRALLAYDCRYRLYIRPRPAARCAPRSRQCPCRPHRTLLQSASGCRGLLVNEARIAGTADAQHGPNCTRCCRGLRGMAGLNHKIGYANWGADAGPDRVGSARVRPTRWGPRGTQWSRGGPCSAQPVRLQGIGDEERTRGEVARTRLRTQAASSVYGILQMRSAVMPPGRSTTWSRRSHGRGWTGP